MVHLHVACRKLVQRRHQANKAAQSTQPTGAPHSNSSRADVADQVGGSTGSALQYETTEAERAQLGLHQAPCTMPLATHELHCHRGKTPHTKLCRPSSTLDKWVKGPTYPLATSHLTGVAGSETWFSSCGTASCSRVSSSLRSAASCNRPIAVHCRRVAHTWLRLRAASRARVACKHGADSVLHANQKHVNRASRMFGAASVAAHLAFLQLATSKQRAQEDGDQNHPRAG